MKRFALLVLFLAGTVTGNAQTFIQLWQVGDDDNNQDEFAQEDGNMTAAPGDPDGKDDDYYFAGIYPAPIGIVAGDELTASNFERALLIIDPINRIHFNLDDTVVPTTAMRLTVDVCCSSHGDNLGPSGPIPFDIYFNDNFLSSETTNGTDAVEEIYTVDFLAGDVGALPGAGNDNVVSIERSAIEGGNWMQFDYVRLEVDADTLACDQTICSFRGTRNTILPGEQVSLSWVVSPSATVSLDQGIGSVDGQTTNGIGTISVSPTNNTTYTLTSTVGGDVQTRQVTVNVQIIQAYTADQFEVVAGTEVFLDWTVDPLASVSIDQGVGNVDAETIGGVGFVSVTPTELETVYTLTATRGADVETATVTVFTNPFTQLWALGTDDNSQAEFSQEMGGATPPPGDPAAVDDDYYFAGIYPPPIGVVASDEPVGNFERALLVVDPAVRIHFNMTAAAADPANQFRVRVNACCSNHDDFQGFSGPIDFSVLFNGINVLDASTNGNNNSDELIFTDVFTGADVNTVAGENIVTIERKTDQGGSWMQFDQIALETGPPPAADRLRITEITYDRDTGQLEITWASEIGALYTVETTGDLIGFGSIATDFPPGGASAETTSFATNVPHATNPEFFIRVRKQN